MSAATLADNGLVSTDKVNRDAGYGLKIPCVYLLLGLKPYSHRNTESTLCTLGKTRETSSLLGLYS